MIKQDLAAHSIDFFATHPYSRPLSTNWDNLKHAVLTTRNKYIPQKTLSSKYTLSWFTRDLRRQHCKKQRLYRRAQTYSTLENWSSYVKPKNIRQKYINRWTQTHSWLPRRHARNNRRNVFKFFKTRRQDTNTITPLKDNTNILITTPQHNAQILNIHFKSV